jgi:sterol 3beta-glucosyltransferase
MRILLLGLGSDGDVEPFLALAQRLMAAGHSPLVATSDRYLGRASALGIPAARVGPPWDEKQTDLDFGKVLSKRNPLKQVGAVIHLLRDLQLAVLPELLALAQDVDVVVHVPINVVGAAVARKLGKPHVTVHLVPLVRGERYAPHGANLGRTANRALWSLTAALLRRATDDELNRVVTAAGLAPWRDIMLDGARSQRLDLIAVSPQLMSPDPGWGAATRATGYWAVEDTRFQPDAALERVMQQRPAVIGFGSMMGFDPRRVTERIVEAVKGLDRQVVIQSGWAKLGASALPANVHVAGFVPHAWLFERGACVVHHGGAGTLGAALRAGIPQAIVWHVGAMPVWDRKLVELGVAPRPRSHRTMSARWLRGTLERLLTDRRMQERARTLGQLVKAEDGLGSAVRAIEEAVGKTARAPQAAVAAEQVQAAD